jgi:formylglycine-generating enzyme
VNLNLRLEIMNRLYKIAGMPRSPGLAIGLMGVLLTQSALWSQAPTWHAAIVKIKGIKDAGTGFIVGFRGQRAIIVTSSHVVEGAAKPKVIFQSDPQEQEFTASVRSMQSGPRSFALLEVESAPKGARTLEPPPEFRKPIAGTDVLVIGYPVKLGEIFSVVKSSVMSTLNDELNINPPTPPGFSGGPVVINGQYVGMIYGQEQGVGKAVATSTVENFLSNVDGSDLWTPEPTVPTVPTVPTGENAKQTVSIDAPKALAINVSQKSGLKFVYIPPGDFILGCPPTISCILGTFPAHKVSITKGFWMGQTEVTVGAWKRFANEIGAPLATERNVVGFNTHPGWEDDTKPIVEMDWIVAKNFCNWIGGRLPTEAEWEYAARAGNPAPYYGPVEEIGWFLENSGEKKFDANYKPEVVSYFDRLESNRNGIKSVALKKPNDFHLYDMLGNVKEWTSNFYDEEYYKQKVQFDPQGPTMGNRKVARGGDAFTQISTYGGVHNRGRGERASSSLTGFRCVVETARLQ